MKVDINKIKDLVIRIESLSGQFNSGSVTDKELLYLYDTLNAIQTESTNQSKAMYADPVLKARIIKARKGTTTPPTQPTPPPPTPPPPTPQPPTTGKNPFENAKLYVNQDSVIATFIKANPQDQNLQTLKKIADQPTGLWLGEWSGDVYNSVKSSLAKHKEQGALPVYVLYNIPNRDNGSYSAGGLGSPEEYLAWIRNIKRAVTDSGNPKVVFILEPDALGHTHGWSDQTKKNVRYKMISDTLDILKADNITTYVDVSMWWPDPQVMMDILIASGIHTKMYGFAVNTSGYKDTESTYTWAKQLSDKLGSKPFIIDTSRSGNGESSEQPDPWCNPTGRAIGEKPLSLKRERLDANIWIKPAGESDGTCRGGPPAGQFYYQRAIEMGKNSKW